MPAFVRAFLVLALMNLFHYAAVITRVIDGDTVVADVDLGMGVWLRARRLRLFGLNTPELRGDSRTAGLDAKAFLERKIANRVITIQTHKDRTGKYGRYLVTVFADNENVNAAIVEFGYGVAA